jgi:hypothetical protein
MGWALGSWCCAHLTDPITKYICPVVKYTTGNQKKNIYPITKYSTATETKK